MFLEVRNWYLEKALSGLNHARTVPNGQKSTKLNCDGAMQSAWRNPQIQLYALMLSSAFSMDAEEQSCSSIVQEKPASRVHRNTGGLYGPFLKGH